jgi:hypothetical protein
MLNPIAQFFGTLPMASGPFTRLPWLVHDHPLTSVRCLFYIVRDTIEGPIHPEPPSGLVAIGPEPPYGANGFLDKCHV